MSDALAEVTEGVKKVGRILGGLPPSVAAGEVNKTLLRTQIVNDIVDMYYAESHGDEVVLQVINEVVDDKRMVPLCIRVDALLGETVARIAVMIHEHVRDTLGDDVVPDAVVKRLGEVKEQGVTVADIWKELKELREEVKELKLK